MTGRPVRKARWKPSSASLPEMRLKLLPLDEQVPEISQGFAYPADSQSSRPSGHRVQPILIFGLFVGYLRRPSWATPHPMLVGNLLVPSKTQGDLVDTDLPRLRPRTVAARDRSTQSSGANRHPSRCEVFRLPRLVRPVPR